MKIWHELAFYQKSIFRLLTYSFCYTHCNCNKPRKKNQMYWNKSFFFFFFGVGFLNYCLFLEYESIIRNLFFFSLFSNMGWPYISVKFLFFCLTSMCDDNNSIQLDKWFHIFVGLFTFLDGLFYYFCFYLVFDTCIEVDWIWIYTEKVHDGGFKLEIYD